MGTNNRQVRPLAQRFWEKVDCHAQDCWTWTAHLNDAGYGKVGLGPSGLGMERAHRISWMFFNGPIPEGMAVLHRCDNRACVRPDHLFLGTIADNNADMVSKGRQRHALSPEQASEIRRRYAGGSTSKRQLAREYGVSKTTVQELFTKRRAIYERQGRFSAP